MPIQTESIQRYSLTETEDPNSNKVDNENLAKGYGFVSVYKSQFILLVKNIEIKLHMYEHATSDMGSSVNKIRLFYEDKLAEKS